MKLLKYTLLFCLLFIINTNASEIKEIKNKVNRYFVNLKTLQAEFVQHSNFEGELTKGLFYIDRPGKLRFEYHYPFKSLLINNDKITNYYDIELDELTTIPSSKTPLSFLLKEAKTLEEMNFKIDQIIRKDYKVYVKVENKDIEQAQFITFVFNEQVSDLNSIIVEDENNNKLTLDLFNTKVNKPIDKNLFILKKK